MLDRLDDIGWIHRRAWHNEGRKLAVDEGCRMRVISIIADLTVPDIGAARSFYADFLGLSDQEFDLGWVVRHTSPDTGATIQLVSDDASAPVNPVVTIKVDDVEAALVEAREHGYEIVHPLTTEPWGITRFFVRAPDGNVFNIAQHHT